MSLLVVKNDQAAPPTGSFLDRAKRLCYKLGRYFSVGG